MFFKVFIFMLLAILTPTTALAQDGVFTISYKVSETREGLASATELPYKSSPITVPYTFKDQAQGVKFIWVEFKDNTGKTDVRSAQIKYQTTASPTPTPTSSGNTSKSLSCEVFGDLDKNGTVNQKDADIVLEIDAGRRNSDADLQSKKAIGDVDNEEGLSPSDALHIQRYFSTGVDFPVCRQAKVSPCGKLGDVTGDGKITRLDAQEAINITGGYPNSIYTGKPYTEDQKKNADVDLQASGGEKVTSLDALHILRYIKGETTTFKGCVQSTPTPTPGLISSKLTTLNSVWTASKSNNPVGSIRSEYSSNTPFNIFMHLSYDFANCPISMTRGANYVYTGAKDQYIGDTEFFLFSTIDKTTQCRITLKGQDILSGRSVPDASLTVTISPAI